MTNRVKLGILMSAVWLLLIYRFAINEILSGGGPEYGMDLFLIDYIAYGVFPLLVIWSFWKLRKS